MHDGVSHFPSRTDSATRQEQDFLGESAVPLAALYGISTNRAMTNSGLGGEPGTVRPYLFRALGEIKAAAALANGALGVVEPPAVQALVQAARELAAGDLDEHLPLEIIQGGGGTAINMNVNEVIANRANQHFGNAPGSYSPVHPNDHANRSQSTNDVFPTAMCIAAYRAAGPALASLSRAAVILGRLGAENEGLLHLGRTCLQDAVPVGVSQLHRTHAFGLGRVREGLAAARDSLLAVPLGGTAVGTGLGTPENYAREVLGYLRAETGLDLTSCDELGDGLSSLEPFCVLTDAMAAAARVLARIAGDLRLLGSGPVGGIGELRIPAVQAGSSMMPGKVNPVIPELVIQNFYQMSAVAHLVALASASPELEVTPMGPVVIVEVLNGLIRMTAATSLFTDRCLTGLTWNRDRVARNMAGSLGDDVESAARWGYEQVARRVYARHDSVSPES